METKATINPPLISGMWIKLSYIIALLVAAVSAAGVMLPSVYAKEHISWAAQGFGQDIINVVLVFPALLICLYLIKKRSIAGLLLWLGLLIYLAYSYVYYAFFMHFGSWFLVYTAILGISFYTLIGALVNLTKNEIKQIENNAFSKWPAVYLLVNGFMFLVLWLMEIIPSLVKGDIPKSATDVGLWLNPVHVMDLAFILPGMVLTAVLLRKKNSTGFLLAVPFMVFAIVMGIAIISMIIILNVRDVYHGIGVIPLMVINVSIGIYLTVKFLKTYRLLKS